MIGALDSRFQRPPRAKTGTLPPAWPWFAGRWIVCGRIRPLGKALAIVGAVLAPVVWLAVVTLLAVEWVSWWAELESLSRSPGFTPISGFHRAFEE
jgi:hypothetical protein